MRIASFEYRNQTSVDHFNNLGNRQRWRPLITQNIQIIVTVTLEFSLLDSGVKYFCEEFYSGRTERIVGWDNNLQIEDASFVRGIHRAIYTCGH